MQHVSRTSRCYLFQAAVVIFTGICFMSAQGYADARTDYLIRMLESGDSYLVKVQAAGSLGKIRSREAVPALAKALNDKDELVVIAAATALSQIGDPSAMSALENALKVARSAAVKNQIQTTLQVLRSQGSQPSAPSTSTHTGTVSAKTVYLAKIDAMGNTSSLSGVEAERLLKKAVSEVLQQYSEIQLQSSGMSEAQVRQKLSAESLQGFILSGSLLKLEWGNNYVEVGVSLNVFSNPDYSLLMMPSGSVRVPVSSAAAASPETRAIEQEKAVRRLVDDMLRKVMEALPSVL
jgi:Tfp pilus assembly protein FimT